MRQVTLDDAIVISGCGWVTPFASGSISVVLNAGDSMSLTSDRNSRHVPIPEYLLEIDVPLSREAEVDRATLVTAVAVRHAQRQACLDRSGVNADRIGFVLGCGMAGLMGMIRFAEDVRAQGSRFVSPARFPQTVGNFVAGAIARCFGIHGPSITLANGDASSLFAIAEGITLLAHDRVDVALAGGTEVSAVGQEDRLFDPAAGMSEGSCWFVLEHERSATARGVRPLARLCDSGLGVEWKSQQPSGLVSTASKPLPGSVHIPDWAGPCPGAIGAAAMAAAIGAANGMRVPVGRGASESDGPSTRVVEFAASVYTDELPAVVLADSITGYPLALRLTIPRIINFDDKVSPHRGR